MDKPFSLKTDIRSKLIDGLLPGVALYLLVMLVRLSLGPVQMLFGQAGLLVLALGLLGVAMFSLQRSLVDKPHEPTRGWYGMAGGLLTWWVAVITLQIDGKAIDGLSGLILLIVSALVLAQLWQHGLPGGGRFFLGTLLLQWAGSLLVYYLTWLADRLDLQDWIRASWVGVTITVAVLVTAWIFSRSETREQRNWAAVLAVTLIFTALGLVHGGIF
jgi:hypothetical protein